MSYLRPFLLRLWNSAVVWSWAFNGLRLASGLLLLPLLIQLPDAEFGFYWVLLTLAALAPMMDLGFRDSIDRAISYAMGGSAELPAQGLPALQTTTAAPNYSLLWKLVFSCRTLYRILAVGVFLILGCWGTYVVSLRVHESSNPALTWVAWGLTLLGAVFEMYSGWWNAYLRGLNEVVLCSRILVVVFAVKFVLSCALLLSGVGLLSVPIASFFSSFLQRDLSKRWCLKRLTAHPKVSASRSEVSTLLRALWPNAWRIGLHYLSGYLTFNANTFICVKILGLAATAEYSLSIQIITICQTMASVWVMVKWPLIFQLRARREIAVLRRLLWPRIWLQVVTFVLLAAFAITCGPTLVRWLSKEKSLLPAVWLLLLAVNIFLEGQFAIWATIILTENRLPFLWPTVATNVLSLALVLCLIYLTPLRMGALILGPMIIGCLFKYWFWMREGARSIQTHFFRFMLCRAE